MKFSVIIPAHNSAGHIRNALDSIAEQTFTDYELIVVCDSCTDNTADVAREYADIVEEVEYHADGPTRNRGIELATGDWVLFMDDGRILELQVEGIRFPVYMRSCDMPLLESLLCGASDTRKRMEFLAPLDPMLWDRKLIEALFGFRYSWEIYTPPEKRKYGYYTLPVLYGDRFIGRIEAAADPKKSILTVRNIWYEPDVRKTKALKETMDKTVSRFSAFNLCKTIIREDQP